MALLYPMHIPTVPLKWEDKAWTTPLSTTDELALLKMHDEKMKKEKAKEFLGHLTDSACNLKTDSDDDDDAAHDS